MRDDLYEHLYRVEDRHWWYVGKRRIVEALLRRFLPQTATREANDAMQTMTREAIESPQTITRIASESPATATREANESPATITREANDAPQTITRIASDAPQTITREAIDSPQTITRIASESPATATREGSESPQTATREANDAPRPRVADIGCGCGAMLQQLRHRYDVVGVDPSPQAREFCARRGIEVAVGGLPDALPLSRSSFDAVLLLDVIEHLDDDDASVRAAAELLKPGGIMVCTSPAYQWLWSDWDVKHHHRRRYTLEPFRALFPGAGLRIELASYANTALFPLAAAARLAGRLVGRTGAGEMRIPPAIVNATLRSIFAAERGVHGRLPMPFGLSVLVVARRVR